MPLRFYQDDASMAVQLALEEHERVLLNLPTGAGKTVTAAHLILAHLPKRCIYLADQDELCQQPLAAIDFHAGVIPALEKAKLTASLQSRVVVASSQTLARKARLERYPPKWFDLAIVDEAHRGRKRDRIITDHLARKVVGITGTPFTATLQDLSKDYETVAYSMPMLDLIGQGFAPPYRLERMPVEIDLAAVKTSRGLDGKDYDSESLSTTIAPYYERIIELLLEHAKDRHTIVFLPLIESSKAFAIIARRYGIQAVHVDGNSPDRAEILEGFRRGRFQMLCNANVVETGVDIPRADCFVNLRPTRSAVRYQQAFGRVLRVLPGVIDGIPGRHQAAERKAAIAASAKPDALIIDFLWQHDELGIYKPENMVATSEEEAQAIYEKSKEIKGPIDLLALQKLVQEEREALLVKRLEEVATRTGGRLIEPARFGYMVGSAAIMSYQPISRWELDLPTEAQLAKLRKWGIDPAKVETKGLASKLMDALLHRFKFKLATIGQLEALHKLGVPFDAKRISMARAKQIIASAKLGLVRNFDSIEGCSCATSPMPPCSWCTRSADPENDDDNIPF